MKIIYTYTTVVSEGSKVHIDSFIKAYRALGEAVVENGATVSPYKEDKKNKSLFGRIRARAHWLLTNCRNAFVLLLLIWREKPDAVLFRFQPMHTYFFSILVSSIFCPVILEVNAVRSIELSHGRPAISDFLDKISLCRARRCFVVSKRLKQHLIEYYKLDSNRVETSENGVDVDEFNPSISAGPVRKALNLDQRFAIGFVGSFRSWHGLDHLIDAAEMLTKKLPQCIFLLVGDGPDRRRYEELVKEKNLSEHFIFTKYIPHSEVKNYIAAMDIVMAPHSAASFLQGFYGSALKIFEYMAMAKPVIAAPMGQIKEVIEDGVSGYLIPSEETTRLVEALLTLYRDEPLRKCLGDNARARVVERYTWKMNAEKIKNLVEEAIHGEVKGNPNNDR